MSIAANEETRGRRPQTHTRIDGDISQLAWGRAPVPLLPANLRAKWKNELLPLSISRAIGLGKGATFEALGAELWTKDSTEITSALAFVFAITERRIREISPLRICEDTWPRGLNAGAVPVGPSIKRLLKSSFPLLTSDDLLRLTWRDLLRLDGWGTRSVLRLATLVEAAIAIYGSQRLATAAVKIPTRKESVAVLADLRRQEWPDQVNVDDARFAHLLPEGVQSVRQWLRQVWIDPRPSDPNSTSNELVRTAPSIKQALQHTAAMSLDNALLEILSVTAKISDVRFQAVARRLGWAGGKPISAREAASAFSRSGQRVRQMENVFKAFLRRGNFFLPQLDNALKLLERESPMEVAAAEWMLHAQRITDARLTIEVVLDAAKLFGRRTTLHVRKTQGVRYLCAANGVTSMGVMEYPKVWDTSRKPHPVHSAALNSSAT